MHINYSMNVHKVGSFRRILNVGFRRRWGYGKMGAIVTEKWVFRYGLWTRYGKRVFLRIEKEIFLFMNVDKVFIKYS